MQDTGMTRKFSWKSLLETKSTYESTDEIESFDSPHHRRKIETVRQRIFQESSFRTLRNRHGICNATLSGRKMLSGEFLKEVSRIRDNNE